MKIVLNQLEENAKLYLFDSRSRGLYGYRNRGNYVVALEELEAFANLLSGEIRDRKISIDQKLAEGQELPEVLASMEDFYVLIDDIDDFCELAGKDMTIIAGRIKRAVQQGITFIVTANVGKFKGQELKRRK